MAQKKTTTKRKPKLVEFRDRNGNITMVTPAQKRAYEGKRKQERNFWVHTGTEAGESYSVSPEGERRESFPKPPPEEQVKQRQAHVDWLREQPWYSEDEAKRAQMEAWVQEPLEGN